MEGIFEITNTKNKRKYYGYSQDCFKGFEQAMEQIPELRRDVEYYGIKAFYFKVLLECCHSDERVRYNLLQKYIYNGREFTKQECYNTSDLALELKLSYGLKESNLIGNDCRQCLIDKIIPLIQQGEREVENVFNYLRRLDTTLEDTKYDKQFLVNYISHNEINFSVLIKIYNYLVWYFYHRNQPVTLPAPEKVSRVTAPQTKRYMELRKIVDEYNGVICGDIDVAEEKRLYQWENYKGLLEVDLAKGELNVQGTLTRFFENNRNNTELMKHFCTIDGYNLEIKYGVFSDKYTNSWHPIIII